MRILKIRTLYPSYLNWFYSQRPHLKTAGYNEQKQALFEDFFSWPETFPKYLDPLGFETQEIVSNNPWLQKAWCNENSLPFNSMLDVALEQIKAFKPEIIYSDDHEAFSPKIWKDIKTQHVNLRKLITWCAVPIKPNTDFKHFDQVVTCSEDLRVHFESLGAKVNLIMHGFDPRALAFINPEGKKQYGMTFLGQVLPGRGYHDERESMLLALAKNLPSNEFLIFSQTLFESQYFRTQFKNVVKMALKKALKYSQFNKTNICPSIVSKINSFQPKFYNESLVRASRPAKFGIEMLKCMHNSLGTFNIHIGAAKNHACNMRLFEATGAGTCLLTDLKSNLNDLFDADSEILVYQNVDELLEKASWIIDHPKDAEQIGLNARKRVLRSHTFENRFAEFALMFRKLG